VRRTSRWAALGAGLLLTTTLAGCDAGGSDAEEDPRAALLEAVEALEDYDGIELVVSLDGDAQALVAASDGDLDAETSELLLDSTVLLRAAGQDEADAQAEVIVTLRGTEAVELRILPEQRFFVRVDLDAIGSAVGDAELAANLDDAVDMAAMFGLADAAQAVRAGGWIELIGLDQLAEMAGGTTTEEEPTEEEVEDVRERLVTSLQRFVSEDVTVTHVDEDDIGERIRATTTTAELAALVDELSTIAGDLSGLDPETLGELPTDAGSDREVDVDLWLDGGELRQVGFDLSQIEDADAPEDTWLLIAVEEFKGSVDAPDDVTQVDLFEIVGGLFGGGDFTGTGDLDEDAFDEDVEDGFEEDPAAGGCIPQEELDELAGDDEELLAELEAAIEMGFLEVC
jgi:hypothetical protein